jgi:hypothetical protein
MSLGFDRAERGFHQLPSCLVLESKTHRASDEGTSTARTNPPVEIADYRVCERNV